MKPCHFWCFSLKRELIKRSAGSTQQKLQKLLNEVELGDRKPSQFLRRMRQLWSERADDSFLCELFRQHLPSSVRMILATSGAEVSLNSLADMADRVMEVATPSVAAVDASKTPPATAEVDSL